MVIDFDVLCDSLDISHNALTRESNSYTREHKKLYKNMAIYISLPSDEQIAIIRYRKLYKSHPEYFTWDGPTEKAEKELTPLLEK
ncbi:hypothetical protein [Lancefieldella rimae]|uniref:hypothetical protein n=1 Tax=Lancefieldella rimae TaxID=1383 RepID=UPI0008A2DBB0|nr:hypothetical protein [Lancefieldella rimae]OFR21523.1 hypothetical protein HMPREF2898_03785 [Atopobium sp. HMSC064B08]